ncbi:unnamed protein product [Camellia sinensis]
MLSILLQRWENKASIWLSFKTEKLEMGQLLWLIYQSSDPADNDAWKDRGTGQLSIKCKEGVNKGTREFKPILFEMMPKICHD